MSGGQMMVVLIVAIIVIARIVRGGLRHEERRHAREADPDAGRLREELRMLKERLAVLERIATDDTATLDRQIEALRDRDDGRRAERPERDARRDRADS